MDLFWLDDFLSISSFIRLQPPRSTLLKVTIKCWLSSSVSDLAYSLWFKIMYSNGVNVFCPNFFYVAKIVCTVTCNIRVKNIAGDQNLFDSSSQKVKNSQGKLIPCVHLRDMTNFNLFHFFRITPLISALVSTYTFTNYFIKLALGHFHLSEISQIIYS